MARATGTSKQGTSLSQQSYKTNNSEMVVLSEIKTIPDDKLTPQSDKVTCLHGFFAVKIRRHKPDKAQALAALTSALMCLGPFV